MLGFTQLGSSHSDFPVGPKTALNALAASVSPYSGTTYPREKSSLVSTNTILPQPDTHLPYQPTDTPVMTESRPPPIRLASAPLPSNSTDPGERPLLPTLINRRMKRAPASDPTMDRIDELDETNPSGLHLHHGGPYEAIQKNIAAPPQLDRPKDKRNGQTLHPMWNPYLAGLTPGQVPDETRVQERLPVSLISLNLSPGEVLPHRVLKTGYTPTLPRPPPQPSLPETPSRLQLPLILSQPQVVPQARGSGYRNQVQPPRLAAARSQSQRTATDAERSFIPPRHQQLQLQQQLQTQMQLAVMAGTTPTYVPGPVLPLAPKRVLPATPPRRQYPQSHADALGQELFLRSEQQRSVSGGDVSPTPSIYSANDPYASDAYLDEVSIGHSDSSKGSHAMWRGMESASQTSHSNSSGLSHESVSPTGDRSQWARPWDHAPGAVPAPERRFLDQKVSVPASELDPRVILPRNAKPPPPIAPPAKQFPRLPNPYDIVPTDDPNDYPDARRENTMLAHSADSRSLQPSVQTTISQQRPQPHHLPKHLVMPTPLQGPPQALPAHNSSSQRPPPTRYSPPSSFQNDAYQAFEAQNTDMSATRGEWQIIPSPPARSRVLAQEIPVHHPDTGKLRKRVTIASAHAAGPSSFNDPPPRTKSRFALFSSSANPPAAQITRTQSERVSGSSSSGDSKDGKDKKPPKRVLSKRRLEI